MRPEVGVRPAGRQQLRKLLLGDLGHGDLEQGVGLLRILLRCEELRRLEDVAGGGEGFLDQVAHRLDGALLEITERIGGPGGAESLVRLAGLDVQLKHALVEESVSEQTRRVEELLIVDGQRLLRLAGIFRMRLG